MLQNQASINLRSKFLRGVTGTFGLRIAMTGFSFVIGVVLARVLGVKEYGIYTYCIAWIALLQVPAELGSRIILAREVAAYQSQGKWGLLKGLLIWMNKAVLATAVGFTLMILVGLWWWKKDAIDPALLTFFVALGTLPFFTLTAARQGAMQGFRAVTLGLVPENLVRPILLILSVGVAYLLLGSRLSALHVMLIRAGAIACSFTIGTALLRKTVPQPVVEASAQYDIRKWTQSMVPFVLISCTYIINTRTDTLMLGMLDGTESAGIYAVASRGADLVTFVIIAVNMSLAPVVSSLYANGEMEKLQATVSKSTKLIFFGCLPIAGGLILLNKWFLLVFGAGFLAGSTAMIILASGQLVNAAVGSAGIILDMTGYERYSAIGTGCGAVLNIFLNLWLIPLYGLSGAAIATASSMAARNLFLLICVQQKIGIRSSILGAFQT